MYKKVTNSTNNHNLSCNVYVNELSYPYLGVSDYLLTTNRLGLLRIGFNNISKKDIVNSHIILRFYNHLHDGDLVFYQFTNSYSTSPSRPTLVSEYLSGNVKPLFSMQFSGNNASIEGCAIDITNALLTCSNDSNPFVWIAFHGTIATNHDVSVIPYTNTTYYTFDYAVAYLCDNHQLINHNSSIDYSCGSFDKSYLNLYTGNLIHIYECYKSNAQKNPLSFSVCYNKNKHTKNSLLGDDFYFNYQFDIYEECDGYIVEDYLGNKRYYEPIDTNDEDFNRIKLGIRHIGEYTGDLYYCYEDASYFYIKIQNNDKDIIELFDSSENHYLFWVYEGRTQLQSVTDSNGFATSFDWENIVSNTSNKFNSVNNASNNILSTHYSSNYIDRFIISTESIKVEFSHPQSGQFKIEVFSGADVSRSFIFNYSSNGLTSVEDSLSSHQLLYTYSSNGKVSSITNKYNSTDICYKNYVAYSDGSTVLNDNELHDKTFFFDNYGRVVFVSDNDGNVKSFAYSEINADGAISLPNQTLEQKCRKNIIINHDFENTSSATIGWTTSGTASLSLSSDSISGGKSLCVTTSSNNSFALSQTIGTSDIKLEKQYKLKLWLKATSANNSGLTVSAIKSYKSGGVSYQESHSIDATNLSTSWRCFESDAFSFISGQINRSIIIQIQLTAAKTIYIDDIQIEEVHHNRTDLLAHLSPQLSSSSAGTFLQLVTSDDASYITNTKSREFTPSANITNDIYSVYKTLSLSGNKGDSFLFNIFANCLKDTNQTFTGFVTFTLTDTTTKTFEFSFDNYLSNWQLLTKGVVAPNNYTNIKVGIKFSGYLPFKVNAIQLYKQTIDEIREYDSCGRLAKSSSNNTDNFVVINSKGFTSAVLSSDGGYIKYSYSDNNTISETTDQYYQKTTYTYNQSGNTIDPISSTLTSGTITITKQHTYAGYQLESITDEFGDKTTFNYDLHERLSSTTYHSQTNPAQLNKIKKRYFYNDINSLEQVASMMLDPSIEHTLDYLSDKETLSTVFNNGNLSYTFTYDTYHRLTSVKLGNEYINQFTYPSVSNTHYHNKVLTKQYGGSGTTFTFSYDDYERPISVSIGNSVKYKYVYDEFGYIYSIEDIDNNIKSYYFYNADGLLLKEIDNGLLTTYKYNNKKELIQKINYHNNNEFTLYSYDSGNDINNREKFFMDFARIYDVDLMYFPFSMHGLDGLTPYEYDQDTNAYDSDIKADIYNAHTGNHKLRIDLSTVKSNAANTNPTKQLAWNLTYNYSKSFYVWFRLSGSLGTTSVNIMQIYNSDGLAFDIRINALGQLELASGNSVIYTSNALTFNSWNCLYLNTSRVPLSILPTSVIIGLNGVRTTAFASSVTNISYTKVILSYNPSYGVNTLPYDVSYFAFAVGHNSLDADTISALSSKSIAKITSTYSTNKFRHKSYFTGNLSSYDYIPLNADLVSIKGLKPNNFIYPEETLEINNPSVFGTNTVLGRKMYKSFSNSNPNSYLSYTIPLTNGGAIGMFYEKNLLNSNSGYLLSLYRNGNCIISLLVSNSSYTLNFVNQSVTVSKPLITQSPTFVTVTYNISVAKLYVDGSLLTSITLTSPMSISSTPMTLYVGQKGMDKSTALNGYIENVSFTSNAILVTGVNNLYKSSKNKEICEQIDKMGRITYKVLPGNQGGLLGNSHTYTYNLTRLSSETTCKNETYNYSYDNANNVTDITGYTDRTYHYDKLNRLIEVLTDSERETLESFEYDINNNVTSHVFLDDNDNEITHTFNYTNGKLTSVTDSNNNTVVSISYSTSSPLYPSSITLLGTSQSLSWQGNRLVGIGSNISYSYNHQGIRISKTVNNVTTAYRLEGNKIIQMNIGTTSLHFRYDLNNILIGLSFGNNEYYYIRDALGIIRGIINSSGNYVVKYTYNAFGLPNKEIQTGYEFDIVAINNPFMYKGYYYDSETGLYYCNSRYYYPLICRWISPDNISYLEPNSLIGINLYAYCKNNPIMYVDEDGNIGILASAIIGLIAGMIIGAAFGGLTAAATGNDVWTGIWTGAIGGAILGAGAGVGSALIATVAAGGTVALAGHSLTIGGAWATGIGIGSLAGLFGGGTQDLLSQLANNKWDLKSINPLSIMEASIENAVFNSLSTALGVLGGTDLSRIMSFLLSIQLNVIPNGYTSVSDIIRYYLKKRRTAK